MEYTNEKIELVLDIVTARWVSVFLREKADGK